MAPLTEHGRKMLERMKGRYGGKKGESVFYASVNAGKPGFKGSEVQGAIKRRLAHGKG